MAVVHFYTPHINMSIKGDFVTEKIGRISEENPPLL
jgi:hypothetical protein